MITGSLIIYAIVSTIFSFIIYDTHPRKITKKESVKIGFSTLPIAVIGFVLLSAIMLFVYSLIEYAFTNLP